MYNNSVGLKFLNFFDDKKKSKGVKLTFFGSFWFMRKKNFFNKVLPSRKIKKKWSDDENKLVCLNVGTIFKS